MTTAEMDPAAIKHTLAVSDNTILKPHKDNIVDTE
jgi:hypothetical protein